MHRGWILSATAAVTVLATAAELYQGDGDYQGVSRFMAERTPLPAPLQADLERLATEGIPVDIVFEQGVDVMAAAR